MNSVNVLGNMTADPEFKVFEGENANATARFTVAASRSYKNKDGNYEADFISCEAWGKTAEFVHKYFSKGKPIALHGSIRTGSYTNKDGQKVYTTRVLVDNVEFVGGKKDNENSGSGTKSNSKPDDGFMNVQEGVDEELPFN